ncbi:hypothetical protein [Flavobacterium sp. IMCC34518]|uniref:hypothetical protein n=1 Tax=Flavobacterium sp. IMCC34518 TaxID=3003623 RepID=UPI0022AC0AED|nr:hypothetical protein [Flavobacterium sp. IMCC34518]
MKNKKAKSIFSSLENYSSIPPPELWDKIETQLDKPKKKKRAIIWWSIAASLLVGLAVSTALYFNSNQQNDLELNLENNTNEVVLQDNSKEKLDKNNNKSLQNSSNSNNKSAKKENKESSAKEKAKVSLNKNQIHSNNQIAIVSNNSSKTEKDLGLNNLNQNGKEDSKSNALVVNQNLTAAAFKSKLLIEKSVLVINSKNNTKVALRDQNNTILVSNSNKEMVTNEDAISKSELAIDKSIHVSNSNRNAKIVENIRNTTVSKSNFNNSKAITTNSKDSLNKINSEVAQLENALVQLDKEKTKKTKEKVSETIDKWSLQVFAGVMSSQNYNNQKALGNTVASQQTSGYGVKTKYKLNKKWGVSSGFEINELGQKIDGVSYYNQQSYSGLVMGSLPIASDVNLTNLSKSNYELVSISNNEGYLFASNSNADTGFEKGNVKQNLKYFEMPLEISYALLNRKKANITMNTGGFVGKLISNDITLNGNSIGENNNVNEYVYGTLLSSTLQYEIYKKTKFFIEPGMNYYINPLENQSFNQFQWMLNVGLNVSF